MSWNEAFGGDPVYTRELSEARAEQFERFREARARFGEPIAAKRERNPHGACGWRLADVVEPRSGPGYVNRTVFPYGGALEPRTRRRPTRAEPPAGALKLAGEADREQELALAAALYYKRSVSPRVAKNHAALLGASHG
ncbi:MAG TPA: hypothetical protein VMV10_10110 [Pirellulales bacterium]|nr:hypothetical protein [Pirellulales bacterium]